MFISEYIENIIVNFDFEPYLNRPLTSSDKLDLCTKLNIPYGQNIAKFNTVKKMIELFYIESKEKRIYINGKRTRVTILKDAYKE